MAGEDGQHSSWCNWWVRSVCGQGRASCRLQGRVAHISSMRLGTKLEGAPLLPVFGRSGGDNGNVFQIVNNLDSTRSAVFQYDPLNRIQQANTSTATGANCWGEVYTIDAWGNLTNRAGVSGMTGWAGGPPFDFRWHQHTVGAPIFAQFAKGGNQPPRSSKFVIPTLRKPRRVGHPFRL